MSVRHDIDNSVVLAVADTGIGIAEKDRDKLFGEFYRSFEARQVFPEGTGLGLAICRHIVEMHEGTITADPRPQGGSVFSVRLPGSAEGGDQSG